MNKVILMEDLSCHGGSSALISIPILTTLGVEVTYLPTMLLATHTGQQKKPYTISMRDHLKTLAKSIKTVSKEINTFFLGYLSPELDGKSIEEIIHLFSKQPKLYFDPAIGDHGKLYGGFTKDYILSLLPLVQKSYVLTPNITEACLILNIAYREDFNEFELEVICKKLGELGPKLTILTGVKANLQQGVMAYDKDTQSFIKYYHENIPGNYFGTGDAFRSIVFALIHQGVSIEETLQRACSFIVQGLKNSDPLTHTFTYQKHLSSL